MSGLASKVGLVLFHGREAPEGEMERMGSPGPVFLVDYVHTTYHADIKLGIPEPAGDGELTIVEDVVYYDGLYYGDWSVFPATLIDREPGLRDRVVPFDPQKARRS